jgi:hypothetical protein
MYINPDYLQGEQNILDARYLVVNRLASKCIQRLGLSGIDSIRAATGGQIRCLER